MDSSYSQSLKVQSELRPQQLRLPSRKNAIASDPLDLLSSHSRVLRTPIKSTHCPCPSPYSYSSRKPPSATPRSPQNITARHPTMSHPRHPAAITSQLRALYRSLLRELPPTPTPLRQRLRNSFSTTTSTNTDPSSSLRQRQEAEQFILYVRAQRIYTTLLERYNPGMGLEDQEGERVRLTARRVGMEMPRGWYGSGSGRGGEEG